MVIESGEPFRQSWRGSSIASKSDRNEEELLSTVWTRAEIVSTGIVFPATRSFQLHRSHDEAKLLAYNAEMVGD
jgi:hypothetical protein